MKKNNTIIVLIPIATSESVSLMPHFAKIEFIPPKNADKIDITIHIKNLHQIYTKFITHKFYHIISKTKQTNIK